MGETAWGINSQVLEQVQIAYKDMKGGFCGLPLNDSVDSCPLPAAPSQVFRTEVHKGQLFAKVRWQGVIKSGLQLMAHAQNISCTWRMQSAWVYFS